MAYGFFGHINSRVNFIFRVAFFLGGVLLLFPNHLYSAVGLAIAIAMLIAQKAVTKKIKLEELSL